MQAICADSTFPKHLLPRLAELRLTYSAMQTTVFGMNETRKNR